MKFPDLLALFRTEPKTLDQARASLTAAAPALDSISALFSAAGLNLEQMLAAGPDSLKAHLTSLDRAAEFTGLQGQLTSAEAKATAAEAKVSDLTAAQAALATERDQFRALLESTGFKAAAGAKPEDFKATFAAHVELQAAALLAKDGRPPVPHVAAAAAAKPAAAFASAPILTAPLDRVAAAFRAQREAAVRAS